MGWLAEVDMRLMSFWPPLGRGDDIYGPKSSVYGMTLQLSLLYCVFQVVVVVVVVVGLWRRPGWTASLAYLNIQSLFTTGVSSHSAVIHLSCADA